MLPNFTSLFATSPFQYNINRDDLINIIHKTYAIAAVYTAFTNVSSLVIRRNDLLLSREFYMHGYAVSTKGSTERVWNRPLLQPHNTI